MRGVKMGVLAVALLGAGCGGEVYVARDPGETPYSEAREPCVGRDPLRHAYYGDLHVHTVYSFDAHLVETRVTPADAYRFAKGEPVMLAPIDAEGRGTRQVRLERPLDFAAVTDHSEYTGFVEMCDTPGSSGYGSSHCETFRPGGIQPLRFFGSLLTHTNYRLGDTCGVDRQACLDLARGVWQRTQKAAEDAYDRTADCSFTSFVAYEYSASPRTSNMHRNVIFKNEIVPFPTSYWDQPTPQGLWAELRRTCLEAGTGCDVLAIPHNSNEGNGNPFAVEYPGAADREAERAQAELRAAMEPVIEIYQHKGDSECINGLASAAGQPDEFCDFEKRRHGSFEDCGDGRGAQGMTGAGCVSRLDFIRGIALAGLQEDERIGANPYRLGIIASTDTHNGTPGAVDEKNFPGHFGINDDTPEKLVGPGLLMPGGIVFSPGGLAAVWAEENSRAAIFDAMRRRETFGTSGTRIAARLFGGWGLPASLCDDPEMTRKAYAQGVPMGSALGARPSPGARPAFLVSALRDPGRDTAPPVPLQRIQIVKGWLDGGQPQLRVFDVAGNPENRAGVDLETCQPYGAGADALCAVWTDADFRPEQHAFYYARVLENPTCRWSTYACNAMPPDRRHPNCSDPTYPKTVQERAWTSPVWYEPSA